MSVYAKDNVLWLKEALNSILNQTYPAAEIILAADGPVSQELEAALKDYASRYPCIKLIYFEQNRGRGAVLHDTVCQASYPLIAIMDSDDIAVSVRLERQAKIFEENEDLDILGGYIEEIDGVSKQTISLRKVPLSQGEIEKFLKFRSPFNHVTVMFKKQSILKIGGYSPLMRFAQDYHLWIRAVANKLNLKNIPEVLVNVRIDPKMFGRRGGYKYFLLNKILQDELLKYRLISLPRYCFNLAVRFCAQVLLPMSVRRWIYLNILRKGEKNVQTVS